MIIQALLKKGEKRPVLELISNEYTADLHFYRNFWIEPSLIKEDDRFVVQISVPDRQENLAVIDPLPEDIADYLEKTLPETGYKIDILMKEFEAENSSRIERPGDIPVTFDFSGDIGKYRELVQQGKLEEAIVLLNEIDKKDSIYPFIELYIAECYIRMNNLEKAEEYLQKEIQERPTNFIAYCSMGYNYRIMGKPFKAKEAYKKSIKIYKNYMNSLLSLTYLFDDPKDLEILIARAIKINSGFAGIKMILDERKDIFGNLEVEDIIEKLTKKSVKINISKSIFLPGLIEEGAEAIDPDAGDLTRTDVFRFCLEEIIIDGTLEERERTLLNQIKQALEITNEEHKIIFKEVEMNFKKKTLEKSDSALEEERLYKRILEKVLADGKVSNDEKEIIKKVSSVLLITPEVHEKLIKEVMSEKGFVV